jgi:hypothetical protein
VPTSTLRPVLRPGDGSEKVIDQSRKFEASGHAEAVQIARASVAEPEQDSIERDEMDASERVIWGLRRGITIGERPSGKQRITRPISPAREPSRYATRLNGSMAGGAYRAMAGTGPAIVPARHGRLDRLVRQALNTARLRWVDGARTAPPRWDTRRGLIEPKRKAQRAGAVVLPPAPTPGRAVPVPGTVAAPAAPVGAAVVEPVVRSFIFSLLLFTLPGLFILPVALPPPAAVCA